MAVFTVSLQQASGVGNVNLGDGTTLAELSVSAGRGPKGDGFTGGSYAASTGKVTFTSNDGIGFETGDIRPTLPQGLDTTDSPEFAGLTVDTDTLYVDSSNNRVGIGTSSPSKTLVVSNGAGIGEEFGVVSGGVENLAFDRSIFSAVDKRHRALTHRFETGGNANSEAMRIDSDGDVLVGQSSTKNPGASNTTTGVAFRNVGVGYFSSDILAGLFNRNSSGRLISMRREGSEVGDISVSTTGTSYNTSSDERLKENIADAQPASDLVDGIQVREFDWKADGEHQRYGMVAQELEPVAPEAVTKGETEDDMWSVDYSKLVPMLVKEIQDLRKRVAALENTQ